MSLGVEGVSADQVYAEMEAARVDDVAWKEGTLGLYVHFGGDDVLEVAKEAYRRFFSEKRRKPNKREAIPLAQKQTMMAKKQNIVPTIATTTTGAGTVIHISIMYYFFQACSIIVSRIWSIYNVS